ncbi:holo-ACP synthase [Listeria newyorkensis]|uniref:Holo-[acyl-carrier-protein] synthase n=1 Tax=Listeria newyorkensis TaxID=1497681 RepID=A0ABX4XXB7_9LIST|nr:MULTISPECIES: holo-ACP synthase [Listeria]KGL39600.1 4'-phosphopantetheinyl transferase [Listeriaceae bacterium FSL A5-0209]KGL44062.1 4'-phosphopantetheinyl transferase [Listeria newyorkensis]KMT61524.1 4'-phosphopantetheinyl transferase [Listeria newyorkensis]PNP94809.1 holo-ACP synthase [Listeria newyorkensis]RQW67143.1 holo-ACP synthase [Listeria sp. SHR_NRA_18]
MIKGVGLDMIDLDRVEKVLEHNPRFVERILTDEEQKLLAKYSGSRKVEFLAGRFSAKEAYAKANGTGFGKDLSFTDVEILTLPNGRPILTKPKRLDEQVFVSITHTGRSAAAQVIIEEIDRGRKEWQ